MTITARYASTCPTCRGPVTPGQRVEWTRGSKAVHTSCSAGTPAPAPRSAPSRSRSGQPRSAGSTVQGEGIVVGSTDRYGARDASGIVGTVFRAGRGWDALTGEIVIVVGATVWFQSEEANEDMGDMQGGGWGATRYVRLATADEAAPVLAAELAAQAARDLAAARKATAAKLLAVARTGDRADEGSPADRLPPVAELDLWVPATQGGGWILALTSGTEPALIAHSVGSYDDYRTATWRRDLLPEDAARVRDMLASLAA